MPRYADGHVDKVLAMPWTQDAITAAEGTAVSYLYYAGRYVRPVADKLLEKPWLRDDITADEVMVIQNIYWMAHPQGEAQADAVLEETLRILDMPFLEIVKSADALAVDSLERLRDQDAQAFLDALSHARLADGITDQEAKMVALLGGTYLYRPESADALLRGTGVHWEERAVTLPLSGEMSLAVARSRDQTTPSMDYLENSVRAVEEFMGLPYETKYIALYFDVAVIPEFDGANFGTHMTILPEYDVENSEEWNDTPSLITHEVAHYYWRGSKDWIDEGAATFLEVLSEIEEIRNVDTSTVRLNAVLKEIDVDHDDLCASVKTIGELENQYSAEKTVASLCDYWLGWALFFDLYLGLGEGTFREGFRNLYLKSQAEDYSDGCEGTELGICHLVAAFKADVTAAQAAKVDEIVAQWYGPLPQAGDAPQPTPRPTSIPQPTGTPTPLSPIAGLENGTWLADNEPLLAGRIAELPWIADGLDSGELEPAQDLVDLAVWYADVFSIAVELDWLQDGVSGDEATALDATRWMAYYGDELSLAVLRKSWFGDGISADEVTVIQNLYWLAWTEDDVVRKNVVEAAIRILSMPFLESVESADALAVDSLERLADNDEAAFFEVLAHPTLADGITDEEAKIVALLGGTYSYRPESVNILLRGTGVYLEERTVDLSHSSEVMLTIIRIRDQSTNRMDLLEHSVRTIEEFMGEPLTTNFIALFFDDIESDWLGGSNYYTHITMSLLYDVEGGRLDKKVGGTMAHLVSYYYWGNAGQRWLTAGAAELLGSISENARIGTPVTATNDPCASAKTIAELESLYDRKDSSANNCNFWLGEAIFLDLYHSLGEDTFRQGFRSLYLKSQTEDYSDDCEGTELGICHLVAAFKADVSEAQAAKVDEIVARWYGPLP